MVGIVARQDRTRLRCACNHTPPAGLHHTMSFRKWPDFTEGLPDVSPLQPFDQGLLIHRMKVNAQYYAVNYIVWFLAVYFGGALLLGGQALVLALLLVVGHAATKPNNLSASAGYVRENLKEGYARKAHALGKTFDGLTKPDNVRRRPLARSPGRSSRVE